jgi:hypothetical protein
MIIELYTDDCLLYAGDTHKIDKIVKTLCDEYTLTLNDPDPKDDFLGIYISHKYNGELHMSQTGLIYSVKESANIPKGRLKTHKPQQQQYYTPIKTALNVKNHGIIHQSLGN